MNIMISHDKNCNYILHMIRIDILCNKQRTCIKLYDNLYMTDIYVHICIPIQAHAHTHTHRHTIHIDVYISLYNFNSF